MIGCMSWTNEVSGRVDGPVVQVGVLVGDVHVDTARPARSAHLAQVEALVPNSLVGRSDELAVLAAFCSSESTAESCLWWRAEAWSGKSALLSWFVLHPPPDVHVVSFFVTSRLPGQNDRRGFVDCVLEQLQDLAECPPRARISPTPPVSRTCGNCSWTWRTRFARRASTSCWWSTAWTRTADSTDPPTPTASPRCSPTAASGWSSRGVLTQHFHQPPGRLIPRGQ
jgi:hypothetical protein